MINWEEINEAIFEEINCQLVENGFAFEDAEEIGYRQIAGHFDDDLAEGWSRWYTENHWYEIAPI